MGASTALVAAVPDVARGALPAPVPAGDDVGFLAFGAVGEGVLASFFAGALKVGRELEALVGGTYLGGLAAASDYGTRLLLGRLLALSTSNRAILTRWAGLPLPGLPSPIDLEAAGLKLDGYIKDPT